MKKINVIVVDDDKDILFYIKTSLNKRKYNVITVSNTEDAMKQIKLFKFDIALIDLMMEPINGESFAEEIIFKQLVPVVAIITVISDIVISDRLFKKGIDDYIIKPFDKKQLELRVGILAEKVETKRQLQSLHKFFIPEFAEFGIVGQSKAMNDVLHQVKKYSQFDIHMLVEGETGTGKELVAKAIHHISKRRNKPFVALNCASLSEELLENELFGHVKGAFTGADDSTRGLLKEAEGGTLFLDEIEEMPERVQSKLLRFIQFKKYRQIGGGKEIKADIRIISATNKNLGSGESKFRKDLFYRISTAHLLLPPLTERHGDLELLISYFLNKISYEHKKEYSLSKGAFNKLFGYEFPGNIRELENILLRAAIICEKGEIKKENIVLQEGSTLKTAQFSIINSDGDVIEYSSLKKKILDDFEINYVEELLLYTRGNVSAAAKLAGVSRKTMWNLMTEHKINGDNYRV